ncbi:MAG: UDP-2,3-diacylglucosamine diphosphatase [Planctomycetes bacterium]|nr:UDP-2,3-diacylglucosamine diphosphatase [Planctomycetota bacterium]
MDDLPLHAAFSTNGRLPHLADLISAPRERRHIDLMILSDVHLGTRSCKAEQLDAYLSRVRPREVVLNGDILDLRELHKGFWPEAHTRVVQRILAFANEGIPVSYVTGNHDEVLRRFSFFQTGAVQLVDGIERTLGGKRTWIVHGDAIEGAMQMPRWLRRIGCLTYHALRGLERRANMVRSRVGMQPTVLVAQVKRMKGALAHISRYEEACARVAASRGFERIITGHIHFPNRREITCGDARIDYLNSGDWVDSMSALEFDAGDWSVMRIGQPRAADTAPIERESFAGLLDPRTEEAVA